MYLYKILKFFIRIWFNRTEINDKDSDSSEEQNNALDVISSGDETEVEYWEGYGQYIE